MSNLAKELRETRLNRKVVNNSFNQVVTIDDEFSTSPINALTVYRVGATIESHICVDTSVSDYGEDLTEAVWQAKRAIIDAVYGEFREPLVMINLNLMNRDYENAKRELEKLERQMFEL